MDVSSPLEAEVVVKRYLLGLKPQPRQLTSRALHALYLKHNTSFVNWAIV